MVVIPRVVVVSPVFMVHPPDPSLAMWPLCYVPTGGLQNSAAFQVHTLPSAFLSTAHHQRPYPVQPHFQTLPASYVVNGSGEVRLKVGVVSRRCPIGYYEQQRLNYHQRFEVVSVTVLHPMVLRFARSSFSVTLNSLSLLTFENCLWIA